MRVLIAEDEKRLAEALRYLLENEDYSVDVVYDGKTALDYIEQQGYYDLFIFDIMMPKMSGLDLLKLVRKNSVDTPVLMLTALSQIEDKVAGLDAGADDYLTKPFQPEELLARTRALTRRTGSVVIDQLYFEDLTLDLNSRNLFCSYKEDNQSIRLSEKEYDVLSLLMRNANQVISKEQLLLKVWGYDSYIEDNNIEAYISFLRKKIRFLESVVGIETVRSAGYTLKTSKQENSIGG